MGSEMCIRDSGLGVVEQRKEFCIRVLRAHELHHLDLVELMAAFDAAHIASGRHLLAPEARREGDVFDGQQVGVEDLLAVQISDRDLRRRNEPDVYGGPELRGLHEVRRGALGARK